MLNDSAASAASGEERRWAIIGEDGRHVWLGRASDPSDAEIEAAEKKLLDAGLAGWLAIVEGEYWSRNMKLTFVNVRPLACPQGGFKAALAAFGAHRDRALGRAG